MRIQYHRPFIPPPAAGFFQILPLAVLFLVAWLTQPAQAGIRGEATVIAVHDGDTISLRMNGKEYRARLIGLDAPEMGQKPWGRRSREHLRALLKKSHWRVSVETDIAQFDKYGRLLVYLRTPGGELVNEQMLKIGYAVLFTIQPNSKHVERFKKAQRIAREGKAGIWAPDGLKESPLDYKKAHPRR